MADAGAEEDHPAAGLPRLHQAAVLQTEDPVGEPHDLGAVRRHHHRAPRPPGETVEQIEHLPARVQIEVPRRLVGEHQAAARGPAPARPPPAAARRRRAARETRVAPVGQPDLGEKRAGPRPRGVTRPAVQLEREAEVLLHRERRNQIEELEDEPHVMPAEQRAPRLGRPREREPVDDDLAGGRHVDPADQVEQRGLARAAPPDQDAELSAADRPRPRRGEPRARRHPPGTPS